MRYAKDILKRLDPVVLIASLAIAALGAAYIALIWAGKVELRNGDYSGRLVLAQNIRLNRAFFLHDIWYHFWPPLPHVFNRLVFVAAAKCGFSTPQAVKVLLTCSSLFGLASLIAAYRLGRRFSSPLGGVFAMLSVAALPMFHAAYISVLGQVTASTLLLFGLLLFAHELDTNGRFYLSGLVFLLASLCRSETVMFSGMLSFLLLARRQWLRFILFNAIAGAFFMVHQAALIHHGSVNYFNWARYYNFGLMSAGDKLHFIVSQNREFFQLNTFPAILAAAAFFLAFFAGQGVIARRCAPRPARYVFLAWAGPLFFMLLIPFFVANQQGRHARDLLFAAAGMAIAPGAAAALLLERLRYWRKAFALALGGALTLLAAHAVAASTEFRRPPEGVRSARLWLEEHLKPGEGVLFENDWSEYLFAYSYRPGYSDEHWSICLELYRIEIGDEPVLNTPGAAEMPLYDLLVRSALQFADRRNTRYIITLPIEDLAAAKEQRNEQLLHRRGAGYVLPLMEAGDPNHRRLYVPAVMAHPILLKRVFRSNKAHIWEIQSASRPHNDMVEATE